MILADINVLIVAHRSDQDGHGEGREWLEAEVSSDRPFALADIAASGFLRIVTNPRVYHRPTSLHIATAFIEGLRFARFRDLRWFDPLAASDGG